MDIQQQPKTTLSALFIETQLDWRIYFSFDVASL